MKTQTTIINVYDPGSGIAMTPKPTKKGSTLLAPALKSVSSRSIETVAFESPANAEANRSLPDEKAAGVLSTPAAYVMFSAAGLLR